MTDDGPSVYLISSEQRDALARAVGPASLASCVYEEGGSYLVDECCIDWVRQVSASMPEFSGGIPHAPIAGRMREAEVATLVQSGAVRLAAVTIVSLFAAGMIAALAVVLA